MCAGEVELTICVCVKPKNNSNQAALVWLVVNLVVVLVGETLTDPSENAARSKVMWSEWKEKLHLNNCYVLIDLGLILYLTGRWRKKRESLLYKHKWLNPTSTFTAPVQPPTILSPLFISNKEPIRPWCLLLSACVLCKFLCYGNWCFSQRCFLLKALFEL